MKTCKDCKWWATAWWDGTPYPLDAVHRICDHPKIDTPDVDDRDTLFSNADVDYGTTTGPDFGCIHFEPEE